MSCTEASDLAERYELPTEQLAVLSTVDALTRAIGKPDNG